MATGSLFKGQRLSDAQYRLCLYLETSRKGPEWWGLRERIAEALGWCVRKVSQVLTQLEALGLIRRIRRGTLTCKRAIELLWLGPRQGALLPQVHRSVNTSASANIVPSQEPGFALTDAFPPICAFESPEGGDKKNDNDRSAPAPSRGAEPEPPRSSSYSSATTPEDPEAKPVVAKAVERFGKDVEGSTRSLIRRFGLAVVRKVVNAVPETARSWGWVVRVSELEAEGTAGPLVSQEDRFFEEQVESLEAAGLHDIAQHLRKRRAEGYA